MPRGLAGGAGLIWTPAFQAGFGFEAGLGRFFRWAGCQGSGRLADGDDLEFAQQLALHRGAVVGETDGDFDK